MKPREHAEVASWLDKAGEDELAAETLVDSVPHIEAVIGFHCQQATEKRLKALLVANGVEPPRTHDLDVVLDAVLVFLPGLANLREDCTFLKSYAVVPRYPAFRRAGDDPAEASRAACERLIRVVAATDAVFGGAAGQ